MRIISGKFKGKKLFLPSDKNTRPLKDMVKESIFNLLEHSNKFGLSLSNSSVLDLFSGCGSFGIECISRGSKNVYFFENYLKALDRRDNPILDKLRKFIVPYDNGEDFSGSHGKLRKSFNHLLIK